MGDTIEVTVTPETKIDPATVTTPAAPAIPDKFKGKSLEDVVAAYTELEKKLGQQAR
jgi:hypothetical protein